MPRFFVSSLGEAVTITGEDARHISRSLRMTAGDALTLCDGKNNEAQGVIVSLSPDAVSVRLEGSRPCSAEPLTRLCLYMAAPKSDKAELIVQKAVELGAAEIVLFLSSRCISRPKADDAAKKIQRLQKIAAEAAKQCGRGVLPAVRGVLSFEQALKEARQLDSFILYEGRCEPLRLQLPGRGAAIALLVGSEGGFSSEEIALANSFGVRCASLGKRILRCETASIAALAATMFALGEMD